MNRFALCFRKTDSDTVIRLPQNPSELPTYDELDTKEYDVVGLGAVMIPRYAKLRKVTISSYFPARVSASVLTPERFMLPEEYVDYFETAMREHTVLTYTPERYMETGERYFTSDAGMQCYVTSFTYKEKGGETGDIYYELTLIEYRDWSPQIATVQDAERLYATPTRASAQDEIAVGDTVKVSGPASPYKGGPSTVVTEEEGTVVRVEDTGNKEPIVFVDTSNTHVSLTQNRYNANTGRRTVRVTEKKNVTKRYVTTQKTPVITILGIPIRAN